MGVEMGIVESEHQEFEMEMGIVELEHQEFEVEMGIVELESQEFGVVGTVELGVGVQRECLEMVANSSSHPIHQSWPSSPFLHFDDSHFLLGFFHYFAPPQPV